MSSKSSELIGQIEKIKQALSTLDQQAILKADFLILRQRLQTICRQILLNNLESALDHKVDVDVWNFAFKTQITALQHAGKSATTNTKRAEYQADLNLFLEGALGFYTQLLEDICETFDINPPFRRKYSSFGIIQARPVSAPKRQQVVMPNKRSALYICQYCLVHVGDIARYLNRISLAENYYQLAVKLVPSVGQPYNQLAIIYSGRSNKLAVTYYSIRSIAVKRPFPVAPTNLGKMFNKQIKESESYNYHARNKWSLTDSINSFLYLQALIYTESDVYRAQRMCDVLIKCLSSQAIFSLLSEQHIFYMTVIALFTLSHTISQTSEDNSPYRTIILEFTVNFLEILLNQAPKFNVREHITLPSIKILLDWLVYQEEYLSSNQIKDHSVWLALSKTLNAIQSHCKDPNSLELSHLDKCALNEDLELECFLPLSQNHEQLDFQRATYNKLSSEDSVKLRCYRLVQTGKFLVEKYPSLNLMDYKVNAKNSRLIFTASSVIKMEANSKRQTSKQNVAIQAIKSRDAVPQTDLPLSSKTNPDTDMSANWTTDTDLPISWTSTNPLGLGPNLPHSGSLPGFESPFADLSHLSSNSPSLLADKPTNRPIGSEKNAAQNAIGSEKRPRNNTVNELLEMTSIHDPMIGQPHMNFSASDPSIFAQHNADNSYCLFPPNPSASLNLASGQGFMEQYSSISNSTVDGGWGMSTAIDSTPDLRNNSAFNTTGQSVWGSPGDQIRRNQPHDEHPN